MLRSLFAGISGLRVNQTMLDVTGNNIANANTVGFKASSTVFQDTLSQMLTAAASPSATRGGTNPLQIGLGAQVAATSTRFTQGSNQTTGVGTDMMINGDGFFVVNDGASQYYTRAGTFSFDASGNLVAADGKYVMGYNAAAYQGFVAGYDGVAPQYTISNGGVGGTGVATWFSALDASEDLAQASTLAVTSARSTISGDVSTAVSTIIAASTTPAVAAQASNLATAAQNAALLTNFADPANPTAAEITSWQTTITNAINNAATAAGITLPDADVTAAITAATTGASGANLTNWQTAYSTDYATNVAAITADGDAGTIRVFRESNGQAEQLFSMVGLELLANVSDPANPSPQDVVNALNANSNFRQIFTASLDENNNLVMTAANAELLTGASLRFVQSSTFSPAISTAPTLAEVTAATVGGSVPQSTNGEAPVENLNPVSTDFETNLSIINLSNNASILGSTGLELQSYEIGSDGILTGVYSDGSRLAIAQLAIANFANPMGLTKVGNSQYAESSNSGTAQIGIAGQSIPGVGQNGTLTVGSVEMSNVDLAAEFTNLILAQRGFEASSKVITTSDTVLGTLVNMVR